MNPQAKPSRDRYRVVISRVGTSGQPLFDEECDAYIVAVGNEYPTSVTSLVKHRGPWRLRQVLVEEIEQAVLDRLT